MARAGSRKQSTRTSLDAKPAAAPFKLRDKTRLEKQLDAHVHKMGKGIRCDTEDRGHATPRGRSPLELVVDATEGFIPLWARDMTLRWRFRESSFQHFQSPAAAKAAVEQLFGEAVLLWGDAAPIKFARRDDAWDFEMVVQETDNCNIMGCTLARSFFPDPGRHDLLIYPKMFEQVRKEQVETLAHEIGHIFGLRHFFAQISETQWPSQIFGEHDKFTIMNYGADSQLTSADKDDLKTLYRLAWSGQLTNINGTPIRFMKPFHTTGEPAESIEPFARLQAVVEPPRVYR